jgi:hypothetical protein
MPEAAIAEVPKAESVPAPAAPTAAVSEQAKVDPVVPPPPGIAKPDAVKASQDAAAKASAERQSHIDILKRLDGEAVEEKKADEPEKKEEPKPAEAEKPKPVEPAKATEGREAAKPAEERPPTPEEADAYNGLDARAMQTLRQAHLLPDKEAWNKLSPEIRQKLLTSARQEVASRTKEFQERQREAERPPATDPDKNPQRGAKPQEPPKAADPSTQSADEEWQKRLTEQIGPDATKILVERQRASEAARVKETQDLSRRLENLQNAEQQRVEAHYREIGKMTRTKLAKEHAIIETDNEAWDRVRGEALTIARGQQIQGKPVDWEQCLTYAHRAIYYEDILQAAQRKIAKSARDTVAGSPVPAGKVTPPPGASQRSETDIQKDIIRFLEDGKTPEEARRMARGLP